MSAECLVCCENFISNGIVYSTPCGHIFHDKCIEAWIKNSMTCPQCRHRTTKADLRRLYFNVNLNSTRLDHNSTASIIGTIEKERTSKLQLERISTLEKQLSKLCEENKKLSADLLSSKRNMDKLKNEFKIEKHFMEAQFRREKSKMNDEFSPWFFSTPKLPPVPQAVRSTSSRTVAAAEGARRPDTVVNGKANTATGKQLPAKKTTIASNSAARKEMPLQDVESLQQYEKYKQIKRLQQLRQLQQLHQYQ